MTQEVKREQLLALRGLRAAACRPGASPAVLLDVSALHGVLDSMISSDCNLHSRIEGYSQTSLDKERLGKCEVEGQVVVED